MTSSRVAAPAHPFVQVLGGRVQYGVPAPTRERSLGTVHSWSPAGRGAFHARDGGMIAAGAANRDGCATSALPRDACACLVAAPCLQWAPNGFLWKFEGHQCYDPVKVLHAVARCAPALLCSELLCCAVVVCRHALCRAVGAAARALPRAGWHPQSTSPHSLAPSQPPLTSAAAAAASPHRPQDLVVPLMKNPNHFHRSPLLGGQARNRTILAFHRGLVRPAWAAAAAAADAAPTRSVCTVAASSLCCCCCRRPPCCRCLTAPACSPWHAGWHAGANGVAPLLPRHPATVGERLAPPQLGREVQHPHRRVSAAHTPANPKPQSAHPPSCRHLRCMTLTFLHQPLQVRRHPWRLL